ncbi:MAG: restriction endonuclease subunit S [Verrucomicrobiota bacterium]
MKLWKKIPFESLLVDSKDGEWGEGSPAVGLVESLIIRGTDFAGLNNPATEFPRRWVKEHIADRKRLQPGDLILETAGGTSTQSTGRSVLLKKNFFDQHPDIPVLCASFSRHLRLDADRFSSRFIAYLLQALYRGGYMAVFNIQHTGVSRFQYTSFKNHTKLTVPDREVQDKIAAILSAYDELIETNQRRIDLLEKLAEEIYREWFVRLRFPGHEKVKFNTGLPTTWKCMRVGAIVNRHRFGKIYRSGDLQSMGSVCVIDQSTDDYLGFYDGKPEHVASVDHPILLFGDHSCKMVFMTKPFSLAENVVPFTPCASVESAYFLFHLVRDLTRTTEYKRHWTDLTTREILVPDGLLQKQFGLVAKQLHEQRTVLLETNRHLARTRDLLLPRLISGKLSVEDLDIQFPPGMAEDVGADDAQAPCSKRKAVKNSRK